jgi:hypothetical protein
MTDTRVFPDPIEKSMPTTPPASIVADVVIRRYTPTATSGDRPSDGVVSGT